MTLSVGLGKIVYDPEATTRTRKALGILSTPGLLVEGNGLTINNDGRLVLRLAPDSGLIENAAGLSIDHGIAGQWRLEYDAANYVTITVDSTGQTTLQTFGSNAHLIFQVPSAETIQFNSVAIFYAPASFTSTASFYKLNADEFRIDPFGPALTRLFTAVSTININLAVTSADYNVAVPGAVPGDTVTVSPTGAPNAAIGAWSGYVTIVGTVVIRIFLATLPGGVVAQGFRVTVTGFFP